MTRMILSPLLASALLFACLAQVQAQEDASKDKTPAVAGAAAGAGQDAPRGPEISFGERLAEAGYQRTLRRVVYDGSYRRIDFPMGDVPDDRGVCTDVVIRAYRALGVDLQERVNSDMRRAFSRYPRSWGLSRPDSNIDHRRVPNLETFFRRQGAALPVTDDPADYLPGDLVSYRLADGRPHIALVSNRPGPKGRMLMIHNIGAGTRLEDFLFSATVSGHFRFRPE